VLIFIFKRSDSAAGFGPGIGGFVSVNQKNEVAWFWNKVSFGFGLGGSIGIDHTTLSPLMRITK